MTKDEFFQNLNEIVTDEIYLTESLDELDKEIQANHWSIGIDYNTTLLINKHDLQDFLRKVIQNRHKQLGESDKKLSLLFYTWFDEQASKLKFNLINSRHKYLPFRANLEFVDSIDQVLSNCLNSRYLDGIPWNELKNTSSATDHKDEIGLKLKVYKEKITSMKAQQGV